MREHYTRIVVIGAGQAGLSAAHHLRRRGLTPDEYVVLDAETRPGGAWQHRWHSLHHGGTNHIHDLPGTPLGDVDETRPAAQVMAEYFTRYEDKERLQVQRPVHVESVHPRGENLEVRATRDGQATTWETEALINATGTWRRPYWPHYPGQETFQGEQHHTSQYRGARHYAGKKVLVVGGGLSAVQLLLELEEQSETRWVTRRPVQWREHLDPEHLRRAVAAVEERVRNGHPSGSVVSATGIGLTPALRAARERGLLQEEPIFTELTRTGARWADGREAEADTILWCTGFRPDIPHLAPLRLREPGGGIRLEGTRVVRDERIHLIGYGPSASTVGATRAARAAVHETLKRIGHRTQTTADPPERTTRS